MTVCRSGTTQCSRASSRASSRLGWTPMSAATGIQLLERVGQRQAARGEQHGEVVEHVGGLLAHALVGLAFRRARYLVRLLAHFRADARRLGEQLRRVATGVGRGLPPRDRSLQRGERLLGGRIHVPAVEAGALAGVTGGPGRVDEREESVGVAVVAQPPDLLHVARGLALVPELLPGAAEEVRLTCRARAREGLLVHVGEREYLARERVLNDARHESVLVEGDFGVQAGDF